MAFLLHVLDATIDERKRRNSGNGSFSCQLTVKHIARNCFAHFDRSLSLSSNIQNSQAFDSAVVNDFYCYSLVFARLKR